VPRYTLRGIGPPHPKQQEIISYLLEPAPDFVKQVDVMCGRGFGKSTFSIDFATRVLSKDGNQCILFLEPDKNRMENTFLTEWRKIVPHELYMLNYGKRTILWKPTGSKLIFWHRDRRGNREVRAEMFNGLNLTGVIDDEAALGFLLEQQQNTFNCIRVFSDVQFYLTITTPRVGEYGRFIKREGHKVFRGTSYDNVYISREKIDKMAANMSRDQVSREIYGELIALEGRIFREALVDVDDIAHQWPDGNVHYEHDRFRYGQPWWLFADLGSATGAYVVVQREPAPPGWSGHIWVAVADYCPQADASASRALQRLDAEFGPPRAVVAGQDVNTRSAADGTTVANIVDQVWGFVPVMPVSEVRANKQLQYDRMIYLLNSSGDRRRFCIAKNFRSLDVDSKRGVIECLQEYEHRATSERRSGEFLPKGADQPLCHVADALMMGAVQIMAPPRWLKSKELAK
jgi:hypothetical protein